MICRNLEPSDRLPWTTEEIGWRREQLDRRTIWVAIAPDHRQRICGMVVGAEVHRTLLILRMLGSGGAWVRPLWRHIRLACFQRQITSFWTFADNERQAEARLIRLLKKDTATTGEWKPAQMFAFAGIWNAIPGRTSSITNGGSGGGFAGSDGLRTGEPTFFVFCDGREAGTGADGSTAGSAATTAENGVSGSTAGRPIADQRITDTDRVQRADGDDGGSTFRSKLFTQIFGNGSRNGNR